MGNQEASAANVPIIAVEASYAEDVDVRLPKVIDGRDAGEVGWSVFPRTGEKHSLIARIQPTHAPAFDLSFYFLSGRPGRHFGHFALSLTTDAVPSLNGRWQPVAPQAAMAMGSRMTVEPDGSVLTTEGDRMIGDAILQLRLLASAVAVTGFRVDVLPFERLDDLGPRLSWSEHLDFCLTEWRIEAIQQSSTTNIALGCLVTASHPLWAGGSANVLTDGLPGSFIHPADGNLGKLFHFDVDLGTTRQLDHFVVRSRADGFGSHLLSQLKVQLFDEIGGVGISPTWEFIVPADEDSSGQGVMETLRSSDGHGVCSGRYIRISSEGGLVHSPQLAEVEAYPVLTPQIIFVSADGRRLAEDEMIAPPGTSTLRISLNVPGSNPSAKLPIRWRLRGFQDEWKVTEDRVLEIIRPSAGNFQFQAQVRHSDTEWDATLFAVPVKVRAYFWQTSWFQWAFPGMIIGVAVAIMRRIGKQREARRLAVLKYESALADERSRIARDMHDEVGARLCQLALMQDLLLSEHAMPEKARETLREIAGNTRQTVDALDHVVWAVNPQHDTLDGVANYLAHSATSYLTPVNINCRLDLPFEWPAVTVRAQFRHHLILAFRETLQNIVKHADTRTVSFLMRYENSTLRLLICDDGRGFTPGQPGGGHDGIANMKSRLAAIGGTCKVRNREEGGTEVEMCAPLQPDEP